MVDEVELSLRYRAKAELRKRAKGLRSAMPAEAMGNRSRRLCQQLIDFPPIQKAERVALFRRIAGRNEVDLEPLDVALRSRGAVVGYPSIDPDTREMVFRESALSALSERGLGFEEPPPDAALLESPHVILVPALQIDLRGHRLGYGAGFYDRTLAHAKGALMVGVVFDFLLVDELPDTPGDIALEWIVTDEKTLEAQPA